MYYIAPVHIQKWTYILESFISGKPVVTNHDYFAES